MPIIFFAERERFLSCQKSTESVRKIEQDIESNFEIRQQIFSLIKKLRETAKRVLPTLIIVVYVVYGRLRNRAGIKASLKFVSFSFLSPIFPGCSTVAVTAFTAFSSATKKRETESCDVTENGRERGGVINYACLCE